MGVSFCQQATGINIATYYAGSIVIQGVGLQVDTCTALLVLGNLGVIGLIFTIAGCVYFVDNVQREVPGLYVLRVRIRKSNR